MALDRRLAQRPPAARRKRLLALGACLAMTLWLFWMADSMTSLSCFLLASALMMGVSLRIVARKPWIVHCMMIAIVSVSASTLFLDLGSGVLQSMGRDPTLTGRTDIWKLVLGMAGNPVFGTGFESFWLGRDWRGSGAFTGGILARRTTVYRIIPELGLAGDRTVWDRTGYWVPHGRGVVPPERRGRKIAVGVFCRRGRL